MSRAVATIRSKDGAESAATISFDIAGAAVMINRRDGCPVGVHTLGERTTKFLLDESYSFFQPPHRWGKGFVLLPRQRAFKWGQPDRLSIGTATVKECYFLGVHLRLDVTRRFAGRWTERYVWRNVSRKPLTLSSIGIRTPFRDVYSSAASSLRECCHAHVFPGGSQGYVWAWPMSGQGPGLGLRVTEGALWAYSIEGRNSQSSSNFRGHIVLHPTDAARSPAAFGGQPLVRLRPGESYSMAWEIGVYADWEDFAGRLRFPVEAERVSAKVGEPIELRLRSGTRLSPLSRGLSVRKSSAGSAVVTSRRAGEYYVQVEGTRGRSRVALQFYPPLRRVVENRIDYILSRHRAVEREFPRDGAFLPVDVETGLRIDGGDWQDWSDARERLAMPTLLQEARRRKWCDEKLLDRALAHFSSYAITCLLGPDGEAWENSYLANPARLYNYPWLAEFFLGQYRLYGSDADLERAALIVEAYYRRGGAKFLAICNGMDFLFEALRMAGKKERANALEEHYLNQASSLLDMGTDLPAHEVNYEQTIVAPLALLLLGAYRISGKEVYRERLVPVLAWLEAFGGPQPHCRLRNIPIRHWDGYWFGRERLWGDTFPHYWSVVSGRTFLRASSLFADHAARYRRIARDIYSSNFLNFFADGGATCAFILPSAVDGRRAHNADPLANDQDWALVWMLQDEDSFRADDEKSVIPSAGA